MTRTWDNVKPSTRSQFPHPLMAFGAKMRQVSDEHKAEFDAAGKSFISLAIGDPALDGNLPPPQALEEKLDAVVQEGCSNGYSLSHGSANVRQAIADYWRRWFAPSLSVELLTAKDVVISCGCSDGLSMAIGALVAAGDRILLPEPLFPQYEMAANYYGAEPVYFPLVQANNWEMDLAAVRRIVEGDQEHKIRALLFNNPSNPCGSSYTREHVEAIVQLCAELRLPIISDEIYAGMTFDIDHPGTEVPFTSVADVSSTATRFIVSGASKRFCIPGQRVGWILRVDPTDAGSEVMKGILNLTSRYFIPMTPVQAAMEDALRTTDEFYYAQAKEVLCENAAYLYHALMKTPGLRPMKPEGGMFMCVVLDKEHLEDDMCSATAFAYALAAEENVHVFPGEAFRMPGAFRLTLSRPLPILEAAVSRITAFAERHSKK